MKNTEAEGNLMRTFENEVLRGDKMTGPLTEVRHQFPLEKGWWVGVGCYFNDGTKAGFCKIYRSEL